jgi:hypothetical protein
VLYGNVNLEYENGKPASAADGIYLHHGVVMTRHPSRSHYFSCDMKDQKSAAPKRRNLNPIKWGVFLAQISEAEGNWFTDPEGKSKTGYYVSPHDRHVLVVDAMNYAPAKQKFYVTVEAEYIQGKPAGWRNVRNVLLDVQPCGGSLDFAVPSPVYNQTSPSWTVPWENGEYHDTADRRSQILISHSNYNSCSRSPS